MNIWDRTEVMIRINQLYRLNRDISYSAVLEDHMDLLGAAQKSHICIAPTHGELYPNRTARGNCNNSNFKDLWLALPSIYRLAFLEEEIKSYSEVIGM